MNYKMDFFISAFSILIEIVFFIISNTFQIFSTIESCSSKFNMFLTFYNLQHFIEYMCEDYLCIVEWFWKLKNLFKNQLTNIYSNPLSRFAVALYKILSNSFLSVEYRNLWMNKIFKFLIFQFSCKWTVHLPFWNYTKKIFNNLQF